MKDIKGKENTYKEKERSKRKRKTYKGMEIHTRKRKGIQGKGKAYKEKGRTYKV